MTGRDNDEMRVLHGNTETAETRQAETSLGALNAEGTRLGTESEVGRLQLLEERAQVQVLREGIGQVQVRKVLRERQEMVPVTLSTEVLEIVVTPLAQGAAAHAAAGSVTEGGAMGQGVSQILIDGKPLQVGQSYEIPLTEERVQVVKQVYPISEVLIRKQAQSTTHQETVMLRHEELEVLDEQGLARFVDDLPGTDDTRR
ncbi:YsnF/AvaK domain-containing protein [Deinococcus wulumuqiensis]